MIGRIANPWPGSHGKYVHPQAPHYTTSNGIAPGSLIEVDGPWPPAAATWNCGTPVVWRVADGRIPLANIYLCVHQVSFEPLAADADTTAESNSVEVNK